MILASSQALQDLSTLTEMSDIVATVVASGPVTVHWNSRSNSAWESTEDHGQIPMIVTDQAVTVESAAKGAIEGETLTIRTVGGLVGNDLFVDDDSRTMGKGRTYLVFLQVDDWIGRDVIDQGVLSPVAKAQGIFEQLNGRWINEANVTFTQADLDAALQ